MLCIKNKKLKNKNYLKIRMFQNFQMGNILLQAQPTCRPEKRKKSKKIKKNYI